MPLSNPTFTSTTGAIEAANALSSQIANKTILITGVTPNSLGAHFAATLASHAPALLILTARDPTKIAPVVEAITAKNVPVKTVTLDLASQKSIRAAVDTVKGWSDVEKIDVLVNNAGVMVPPYTLTAEGIELQFGTNHIGHFLFTNLLLPQIRDGGRVVTVSSDGHRFSPVLFDDYNFSEGKTYHKWIAYGASKTANMLFAISLASKYAARGIRSFSLHPGVINTNLARTMTDEDLVALQKLDAELQSIQATRDVPMKSVDQGAATHVIAAFDPALSTDGSDGAVNGAYLMDCQIAPEEEVKPYAADKELAEKLWVLSQELVGEKFA